MSDQIRQKPTRRQFLTLALAAPFVAACQTTRPAALREGVTVVPSSEPQDFIFDVSAKPADLTPAPAVEERRLKLENLHTEEVLDLVYWRDGDYVADAMRQFNHLMRDRRDGKSRRMDPALYDLLAKLHQKLGLDADQAIQVICGYRSPETNARLAASRNGVARKSYHVLGMAADIRIKGVSGAKIAAAAEALGIGGYAYYPRSNFVHVDTGPVRTWKTS